MLYGTLSRTCVEELEHRALQAQRQHLLPALCPGTLLSLNELHCKHSLGGELQKHIGDVYVLYLPIKFFKSYAVIGLLDIVKLIKQLISKFLRKHRYN